jgi:NADH:ubiquinone oxidoreductase subunit 4 (subunit M)
VLVMIVWIGVYPRTFTAKTEATVQALIAQVESKASVARIPAEPRVAEAERPR